ncbi:MAG: hypothetical protein LKE48_02565 [Solobacterium sp.]|jgi:methyl-accepting chemotaxis protein|nr:hypothetical protein [Solobacterium sp.]
MIAIIIIISAMIILMACALAVTIQQLRKTIRELKETEQRVNRIHSNQRMNISYISAQHEQIENIMKIIENLMKISDSQQAIVDISQKQTQEMQKTVDKFAKTAIDANNHAAFVNTEWIKMKNEVYGKYKHANFGKSAGEENHE